MPSPFLASAVLAADAFLAVDDAAANAEYLPAIAAGDRIASLAVAEGSEAWVRDGGSVTATPDGDRWAVTGSKTRVVHGNAADLFVVFASTPDGPGWFVVDASAAGVERATLTGLDHTRRFARVVFSLAPARRLTTADPVAALDRVADLAAVAVAAEQVGGLERALEMTADYAKIRVQFGRAIGSYQAVKHGLADMYCSWELALSVVRYAAWAAEEAADELPLAAALAQVYVGPAFFDVAMSAIQYHGGIGFTWEHDAHLYYKRAKSDQLLFGSASRQRSLLADRLGI